MHLVPIGNTSALWAYSGVHNKRPSGNFLAPLEGYSLQLVQKGLFCPGAKSDFEGRMEPNGL